jgi:hypothetical protein
MRKAEPRKEGKMKWSEARISFAVIVLAACFVGAEDVPRKAQGTFNPIELDARENGLTAKVLSVRQSKKELLYMPAGGGSAETGGIIEAPATPIKEGVPTVIMVKDKAGNTHTFTAGSVDIPENEDMVLVVIECEVGNPTDKEQSFRIGELAFRCAEKKEVEFCAVGLGKQCFTKFTEAERNAAKATSITLKAKEANKITYMLGGKKRQIPLECSFRQGPWKVMKRVGR